MLQTARFYARLYYHAQTRAHNLLCQKVITCWVSAIVSYILTNSIFLSVLTIDQNIINVSSDKIIKAVSENIINVALKET